MHRCFQAYHLISVLLDKYMNLVRISQDSPAHQVADAFDDAQHMNNDTAGLLKVQKSPDLEGCVDGLCVSQHVHEVVDMGSQVLLEVGDSIECSNLCIRRGNQGAGCRVVDVEKPLVNEVQEVQPVLEDLVQVGTVLVAHPQHTVHLLGCQIDQSLHRSIKSGLLL